MIARAKPRARVERGSDGCASLVDEGGVVVGLGRGLHEPTLLELLLALEAPITCRKELALELARRAPDAWRLPRAFKTIGAVYRRLARRLAGTPYALCAPSRPRYGLALSLGREVSCAG